MFRIFFALLFLSYTAQSQRTAEVVQIKTQYGKILVWLYDETPRHKASFIQLTRDHYWDSLTFNRVIPNFVIQGGCPDTPEGFTNPEYLLKPEFVGNLKNTYGAFAAGRDDNPEMLSARCQFYIVQSRDGISRLNGKYTVYGKVFKGMDVVDKIANVPRDAHDEPITRIPLHISLIKIKVRKLAKMGILISTAKARH